MSNKTDWEIYSLPSSIKFKKIEDNIIKSIEQRTELLDPIIPEIFNEIIERCINDFNFSSDPIPFKKYLQFYQEVKRLRSNDKKKITYCKTHTSGFFVGDLHGAIKETFLLIDFFYRLLQNDKSIKIVFVGDYVDRNPFDLETLTLVTAFQLQFPDNVELLRGNHEDEMINQHYGFYDNLLRSYWEDAEDLYKEISFYFSKLPLINIMEILTTDERSARVMTVHGGIPIDPMNFMDPINLELLQGELKSEVTQSEKMDPISVSILWSDPDEMIQGILTGSHLNGRMKFGYPVFKAFMEKNNLDLVVRGHQKWKDGYHTFFGGKLYSLFSTSTYDGIKQFSPKFLQLKYGSAPKLIEITSSSLQKEIEEIEKKMEG